MNRRALLASVGAVAVAGCVGAGGSARGADAGSDDDGAGPEAGGANATDEESESSPAIAADPDLRSTELVEVDPGPSVGGATAEGEAAIGYASEVVTVAGTVVGETGCHGAGIADAAVDGAGGFRVVVAAVDRSAPDRLCTQSLTAVGYELEARFDGGVPGDVAVVHDDARGRETVATDRAVGA
jgi:hypothetical protein